MLGTSCPNAEAAGSSKYPEVVPEEKERLE